MKKKTTIINIQLRRKSFLRCFLNIREIMINYGKMPAKASKKWIE